MIVKCDNNDYELIMNYIGDEYGRCLYVYIDLFKYRFSNPEFQMWKQTEDDKITCIVSKYYSGMQIFSRECNYNAEEVAELIKGHGVTNVFAEQDTLNVIKPYFDGYNEEIGIVGQLSEITAEPNESAYRIGMDELPEAAGLVAADEGIGVPYGYDSLLKQYTERMEEDFGRNYLLRGGVDNSIACHVATYAETPKIAVIGGVITSPEFRGKGVSKGVLAKLCRDLKEEGKDVFSFYYIPAAKAMHEGVGFKTKVVWAKLFK